MILETGLRNYLLSLPTITAMVQDRIYGVVRAQGQPLPDLLITRTQTTRQTLFCRTSKLVSADLQLDADGMTGDSAWGLAAALRAALVDFGGMMDQTSVNKVFLTNEFPGTDPDPGIIRVTQLYNIWYLED